MGAWLAALLCMALPTQAQTVYNTALDVNNLDFVNLGTYFSLDNEAGAEGGTALASNPTGNNGKATLRLKIEGPLSGTFNWKVSSEEQFDKLIFRIDGSEQDSIHGIKNWQTKSFNLGSGEHTLEWSYEKDNSGSKYQDRGWIDRLVLDPRLVVHGGSPLHHEVGTAFQDPGATYYDASNIGQPVGASSGVINASVPGNHTLTYTRGGLTATRTVSVLDTTPPVITLRGDAIQNVLMGAPSYSDPGAVAYDAYEGTLGVTSSGVVDPTKQGDYIITYNASDGSGNSANPVTRTVRVLDTLRPVISLNGAATVTQEAAEPYTDPGATALDNGDTPVAVSVSGNVDVNTLGSHVLTYNASDASGNAAVPRTRTVIVVDTQAPVITLNGSSGVPTTPTETEEGEEVTSTPVVSTGDPSEITVEMGGTFVDPGAIAVDAFDGVVEVTVSGSVDTSKAGTYPLTYLASDSSGNVATPTVRTVRVADTQAPVIVINGDAVLNHEVGQSYTDAGAEVQGENLPITTEGEVDVNTLGTYTISYSATDNWGNVSAPTIRTVTVRDTTAPQISLNGSDEIIHPVGESYTDAGASATDIGDQNPQVTVSGTVNTEVLGNYVLTYTATDASGNQSQSVRREVSVVDITAPTIQAVVANKVSKNWNFDAASGDEFLRDLHPRPIGGDGFLGHRRSGRPLPFQWRCQ